MNLLKYLLAAVCLCIVTSCSPVNDQAAKQEDEQWIQARGNDAKAMDERFGTKAGIECASKADDYLRSIARYDFGWDDDASGLGGKFTKYAVQSTGLGMMTEISEKAKLSNGFGAFEHVTLYCLYNAATDEVVRFSTYNPYFDTLKTEPDDSQAAADNHPVSSNISIYTATNEAGPAENNSELAGPQPPQEQPDDSSDGVPKQ